MNLDLLKRGYWDEDGGDGADGGTGDAGGDTGNSGDSGDSGDTSSANGFSETWREDYAGEDEGKLAQLSRYASPNAAFDGLIATKQKISSGEFKSTTPFPTEGTEEEQGAWRDTNGIPKAASDYKVELADGRTIGEDDKPFADEFLAAAHASNMSPAHANAALNYYYDNLDKQLEARSEADIELRSATEDTLRAEWGNEYRSNVNRIQGLLDTAPEGVKDDISNARMPDGTPLMANPETLKFFVDMALQINPATTLVPGAGDNIKGAVSDEMKTLEGMMGNKNSEYWKGPKADDNQKRYRDLTAAAEKMR